MSNRSAIFEPLTRDRIVATAEDVVRRFGPEKATVVDVARALGVSHAAVYRHVLSGVLAAGPVPGSYFMVAAGQLH